MMHWDGSDIYFTSRCSSNSSCSTTPIWSQCSFWFLFLSEIGLYNVHISITISLVFAFCTQIWIHKIVYKTVYIFYSLLCSQWLRKFNIILFSQVLICMRISPGEKCSFFQTEREHDHNLTYNENSRSQSGQPSSQIVIASLPAIDTSATCHYINYFSVHIFVLKLWFANEFIIMCISITILWFKSCLYSSYLKCRAPCDSCSWTCSEHHW